MVKLRILLTVFIFSLKAEAQNYGKQRYISDARLWCSDNHNALDQLANQNRLCLSKGGFCRKRHVEIVGVSINYNNVPYLENNVFFEHYSMSTYSVTPNTPNIL